MKNISLGMQVSVTPRLVGLGPARPYADGVRPLSVEPAPKMHRLMGSAYSRMVLSGSGADRRGSCDILPRLVQDYFHHEPKRCSERPA